MLQKWPIYYFVHSNFKIKMFIYANCYWLSIDFQNFNIFPNDHSKKILKTTAEEILSYFEIVVYCGHLLDITEGSHASQDPVVWALHSLEEDEGDVVEISSRWFLVHRALVKSGITSSRLYCVHMHNRQRSVQHLQFTDMIDLEVIITARKRSLGQGNVFYTCLSVILFTGRHPRPPTATEAGGTHPIGMHSC